MSGTLQYKGYDGSVLYSAEDGVLHGRILGIRDMVSKAAVDEYLAFCAEQRWCESHISEASMGHPACRGRWLSCRGGIEEFKETNPTITELRTAR